MCEKHNQATRHGGKESDFNSVDTIFINKAYFIHEKINIPFTQAFYNYQNKNFFINVYVGDIITKSDKEMVLSMIGWLEIEGKTYEMIADVYLKQEGLFLWKIKKIQSNSRYFYLAFFS